ncbi:MAG: isoleucine--tRNA ligase [Alphaproteobacteria bacterium]|nr:isoleucine--tRNA ligase [Alphaproteobacteria bacterium]
MSETRDENRSGYKDTIFLPQTDFPMRAGLPQREPEWLARWQAMDLHGRLRADAKGREKFILHDGPPYANGHLHMGHALNKILKDIINRSRQMMGFDAFYVPGWDCHGLPIEWMIEEKYRKAGKNKDEVPLIEFRRECRDFAANWISVQREEFKRLGVLGDWEHPYSTMAYDAEAQIVREFIKFVMNGGLYRGSKPVLWSVVEKTALAEAEVEYHDHVSNTIWVKFPVATANGAVPPDAYVVIWTTTPWTIPANRAIAFSPRIAYGLYQTAGGEKLILADALADQVRVDAKIETWERLRDVPAETLAQIVCHHPLADKGFTHGARLYPADFVTDDAGTGFVHIAPSHGADDFELGVKHGIEAPFMLDDAGVYLPTVPLFAGKRVLKPDGKPGDADTAVIQALRDAGRLLANGRMTHQYPHSWRSKAPLILRNTPQWFISMTTNGLRQKALAAIDQVQWIPESGRARIRSMIENRPDWVVSRQRAWGVPLTCFVHRQSGALLRDEAVNARIISAVEKEGCDVWFTKPAEYFLAPEYRAEDYEMVQDILDVWFDSGSTHAFVLENRPELRSPADLYLEGTDQHRGWFHSSLLESCGTRGVAPYKAVLTHGFLLAEDGRKMSKSLGNDLSPIKVSEQSGAEILRLWAASSDYANEIRFGQEVLKTNTDSYRKLRNTLRFMLGTLTAFDASVAVEVSQMPELERWVLHRLHELDALVRQAYLDYDFARLHTVVFNFCASDLSALYFDIRKDALYCDAPGSLRRRACLTVMDQCFLCLTAWLAPILSFTMEEAWTSRFPGAAESVHLRQFPEIPAAWKNPALGQKWSRVRALRHVVTGALELERREKRIGASLEAAPHIHVGDRALLDSMQGLDINEIAITSGAVLVEGPVPENAFTLPEVPGAGVVNALAGGGKCQRCWMILPEVGTVKGHDDLCRRCASAVSPGAGAE